MISPPISTRHQNSDLHVVPAIHFRSIFAAEVNRLCADRATRPEAIAVELGPVTAAAALKWIEELGSLSDGRPSLPVMLALVRRNRMLRASLKEKAMRLQKEIGKDLSEISPDVLHRELDFANHQVLFLSPVDSIIEAIRCAFELRVPLYGVDLEEAANGLYEHVEIQDPQSYKGTLSEYLAANLSLAGTMSDCEIDPRREAAMAARLKTIMERHRRILFTCGMAHWLRIERMLEDKSLRPAFIVDSSGEDPNNFKRVVVHPSIAARHMDLFPPLAQAYEKRRIPLGSGLAGPVKSVNAGAIFRSCLKRAYRKYFSGKIQTPSPDHQVRDLESLSLFEGYLRGIQQLSNSVVPDLFMIVQAARETMSSAFVDTLADTFMKFPWATPGDHPECGSLMPPENEAQDPDGAILVDEGSMGKQRIYMRSFHDHGDSREKQRIPHKWAVSEESMPMYFKFTWRPWEYLITSMSFRAIQACNGKQLNRKPVPFEGSLLDGIDIKSTLKSFSRGKDCMYVRDFVFKRIPKRTSPRDGFPVIWILNPEKHGKAEWKVLHEPFFLMERHIKDIATFRKIRKTKGDRMIASIGYGYTQSIRRSRASGGDHNVDHYYGIVIFQPICWTNRQYAHWADLTHYSRNPFYSDIPEEMLHGRGLKSYCEQLYGIRLDAEQWITALILATLPFCGDSLTVVIPDSCPIEHIAYEKARRRGVKLAEIPLNLFSEKEISRLAECQMVPAIELEPETRYSKSVERTIGESQSKNRELVPPEWLNYSAEKWCAST